MAAEKRVQIFAISTNYRVTGVFVCPHFDEAKQCFVVGDQSFKAEQPRIPTDEFKWTTGPDAPLRLTDAMQFEIRHENIYDMSDPKDALIIGMAKHQGVLADNLESINPGSTHVFYLKDEEEEANVTLKKAGLVREALATIDTWQMKDIRNFCFLMGQPVITMTPAQVTAFVSNMAMQNPKKLLESTANSDWKYRALLKRAVVYNVITLDSAGVYKLGDNVIGVNESAAVHYMMDKANETTAKAILAGVNNAQARETGIGAQAVETE
jgi:hypothetical protein